MSWFKRKKTIQINYKSGHTMFIKAEDFTVSRFSSGTLEITWKNAYPRPLTIGVDEVESVWVL